MKTESDFLMLYKALGDLRKSYRAQGAFLQGDEGVPPRDSCSCLMVLMFSLSSGAWSVSSAAASTDLLHHVSSSSLCDYHNNKYNPLCMALFPRLSQYEDVVNL